MAKNRIHNEIDALETSVSSQSSAISTLQGQANSAAAHIALTGQEGQLKNPHNVTAADVGAATPQDVANAVAGVVEALDWKEMVPTFADLATNYPAPEEGWTASVAADDIVYRYNGSEWVAIIGGAIPLATNEQDGLLSSAGFTKLAGIEAGAEVNQTDSEIKTAYENNADTNAFTDAEKTKLGGIEAGANNYTHPANHPATFITYDNQESTLTSTALQGAIDELDLKKLNRNELGSSIVLYPTDTVLFTDGVPYFKLVDDLNDPDYDSISVDITTPEITGVDQLVASLSTVPGVLIGNPGIFTANTIGLIRKASGNDNQKARFYYKIFKRNSLGAESEVAVSDPTSEVTSITFEEFNASALFNNGDFTPEDRIVIKYYASVVENPGATYQFQFGGTTPVRTLLPVPIKVIPVDDASAIVLDTSNFDGLLTNADDTVQKALNTLDDHNHDGNYVTPQQLTDAIDAAELSLGTNFAVADIAARDALTDLTVGDQVFVTDDGDTKWAIYKVTGIEPNVFTKIMDQDLFTNAVDAAAIKASYESNNDTNAFTDNEKTKLSNILFATQAEAEAGTNAEKYMSPLLTSQAISALVQIDPPVFVSGTAPITAEVGDLWFDPSTSTLKVYYVVEGVFEGWLIPSAYGAAQNIGFDNTNTNIGSTNVQNALFELGGDVDSLASGVASLNSSVSNINNGLGFLNFRVRPERFDQGFFNGITFEENGQQLQVEDYSDITIGFNQRIGALENATPPSGGGDGIGVADYTFTIPTTDWTPGAGNAFYTKTISVGEPASSVTTQNYELNFTDNVVFGGTPNLPPQSMTWSSTNTSGPITITKNGGGTFNGRFVGGFIRVQNASGGQQVHYIISAVVDENNVTAYYQAGPSQGNTLESLTNELFQGVNNINFVFMVTNGTGPNPEDPKVAQIGLYEEQTAYTYSVAGSLHAETTTKTFTIPEGANSIAGFSELSIAAGIRYYAIILGNNAYVATANGVRRIAKYENGIGSYNDAQNYGEEVWQDIGNTPIDGTAEVAVAFGASANRATHTDWTNASAFPSIDGITQIRTVIGLEIETDDSTSRTQGFALTFNTGTGAIVGTADQVFLDIAITSQNIGSAAAIETAWSKVKAAPVVADDSILIIATEVPEVEIPVRMAVFK